MAGRLNGLNRLNGKTARLLKGCLARKDERDETDKERPKRMAAANRWSVVEVENEGE